MLICLPQKGQIVKVIDIAYVLDYWLWASQIADLQAPNQGDSCRRRLIIKSTLLEAFYVVVVLCSL
jgi:hypothetical protein